MSLGIHLWRGIFPENTTEWSTWKHQGPFTIFERGEGLHATPEQIIIYILNDKKLCNILQLALYYKLVIGVVGFCYILLPTDHASMDLPTSIPLTTWDQWTGRTHQLKYPSPRARCRPSNISTPCTFLTPCTPLWNPNHTVFLREQGNLLYGQHVSAKHYIKLLFKSPCTTIVWLPANHAGGLQVLRSILKGVTWCLKHKKRTDLTITYHNRHNHPQHISGVPPLKIWYMCSLLCVCWEYFKHRPWPFAAHSWIELFVCGTCVKKPVSFVLPDSLLRAIDLFVESTSHRLSLPISLAHGSFWKLTIR